MKILRRVFKNTTDGSTDFDDVPATVEEAERLTGCRLDRRRNYCIIFRDVCALATWSQRCSGCEGAGCFECRGRGNVRISMYHPWPAAWRKLD
ncbi:MAG: hypothetical protein KGL39_32700 [Patescibacteria group bacterium]|nr:hypothetical protein [Patescibacteria group bacterium]